MRRARAAVTTLVGFALIGCGPSEEPEECGAAGDEPHWRRLAAPEQFRFERVGGDSQQTAFWNRGALWLFGQDGGAIWDLATNEWTPMPAYPGNLDQPQVAVSDEQLIVFGGVAPGQGLSDHVATERMGWRFLPDLGWQAMEPAPEWLVYAYRSWGSKRYFYAFTDASPPRLGLYEPSTDQWTESPLPEAIDQLPSVTASCVTSRGWMSARQSVKYFDESTSQWTVTTAPGAYQAVCVGEHLLGWGGGAGERFSFEDARWIPISSEGTRTGARLLPGGSFAVAAPADPRDHALPADNPNAGWRIYDLEADTWDSVPRQCEPEWPRHFSIATDYGLVVWEQASDEDPHGEGRLLVLPDSKPLPER